MQDRSVDTEVQGDKQLVLGFDAGCFTCSDLAARIEDRVGDRLAVRNLNDPEVQGWRKEALGEDAKWAPTLFHIEDDRIQAWAGWRMGWALSRAIGFAATWQVMQALGEVGAAPRIEESAVVEKLPEKAADAVVGMTRGRFLKGVGGAAVAASVMSGNALLPSAAEAATSTGTREQRRLAILIVQSSKIYKHLANMRASIGARYDFGRAVINIKNGMGAVTVRSLNRRRSVIAFFLVNLRRKMVLKFLTMPVTPINDGKEVGVTLWSEGKASRRHHRTVIGKDYVIDENGRRWGHKSFLEKLKQDRSDLQASSVPDSKITTQQCLGVIGIACGVLVTGAVCAVGCAALGFATLGTGAVPCAILCALIMFIDCDRITAQTCRTEPLIPANNCPPDFGTASSIGYC